MQKLWSSTKAADVHEPSQLIKSEEVPLKYDLMRYCFDVCYIRQWRKQKEAFLAAEL